MAVRWWRAAAWARVTLAAAVLLRVADELPAITSGLPRGARPCADAAEAARRLQAKVLAPRLPAGSHARWSTWAGPSPAAELAFTTPAGFTGRLWLAARPGDPIPRALAGGGEPFHAVAARVGGRPAMLSAVHDDGEVWEHLAWEVDGRQAALRYRGRTRDALQLAAGLEEVSP